MRRAGWRRAHFLGRPIVLASFGWRGLALRLRRFIRPAGATRAGADSLGASALAGVFVGPYIPTHVVAYPFAFPAIPSCRFHPPAQPMIVSRPPSGPDWIHEVKHDGYRLLASKAADRVTLWTRYGTDFTDRLRGIAEAVAALPVANALIDGEAVTFLRDGHSDFGALRTKAGRAATGTSG